MLKLQLMTTLGFSPCPNDTFIFYAIANKRIDISGLEFNIIIEDVERLNRLAMERAIDVTKTSCHAFYYLQDDYEFLVSGGAFGRGCGPLLVQKSEVRSQESEIKKIAIPGELTTAFLLLKLHLASNPNYKLQTTSFIAMPFHEVMGAVSDGRADAGLIIHEGRFTYQERGLELIADLGEWWEGETGLPVPLGGIIAKKSLGSAAINIIEDLIKRSTRYAYLHSNEAAPYIKSYAQELSDDVIKKHISLYVNDYTIDMGDEGKRALKKLLQMTKERSSPDKALN
ncbi:MAG: 1,4-dihydroxy-6-naphthoate synthase [Nitrospirae bacterium]|nr:1,4-dihydroxy-6-naphthoate synthase [Nitrospirota bacterium]